MPIKTKIALLAWALVGAPVLFAAYVWWTYRYSLARAGLPFSEIPEWTWFLAFGLSVLSGALALYLARGAFNFKTLALIIGYVGVIVIGDVAIHLAVACWFGDCI